MNLDARLNFRVRKSEAKRMLSAAQAENRPLSNWIRVTLLNVIRAKKTKPKERR